MRKDAENDKYQELKAEENQYVMNTYGRFPDRHRPRGEGAIWDLEGRKYIDRPRASASTAWATITRSS